MRIDISNRVGTTANFETFREYLNYRERVLTDGGTMFSSRTCTHGKIKALQRL